MFAIVLDEITLKEVPWCMMFVDYITLEEETRGEVNAKLEM